MKVVLIQPFPGGTGLNEATVLPPLGIASIAAMLEQRGVFCQIIDANLERLTDGEVLDRLPSDLLLVGISMNSFTYDSVCRLARNLLADGRTRVVLGGPTPTAVPEQVLADVPGALVVRGEGEHAMAELVDRLAAGEAINLETIPGVYFLDGNNRMHGTPPRRIENLEELPFPAYHLLPPLRRYRTRNRRTPAGWVITSRGCSFDCSFCSKDVFQNRVTWRSPGNVLAEIDLLVELFGIRQLDILDDNIAMNRSHLEAIMDGLLERRYDLVINLQTGVRTENLDEPLLKKMRRAGVFKLAFGVESADSSLLAKHGKPLDLNSVAHTVAMARRLGFVVYGFFIIGLPGETDESFARTMDFVKGCRFHVANFCLAIPFPGTDLYKMVEQGGRFLIDTTRTIPSGFYDGRVFFEYGAMDSVTVQNRYQRAYKEFYTFSRRLRALATIRSLSELRWLWQAWRSVNYGRRYS